jgi:Kef-type K+ transport system membrane component KefB
MLMFAVETSAAARVGPAAFGASCRPGCAADAAFAVPAGFALARVGPDRPLVLAVVTATSSAAVALPILQDIGTARRRPRARPAGRRPGAPA